MSRGADKATGRLALGILLGCGLVLGTAGPAFAQRGAPPREPHRFYVSVTAFGDIERFSQDSTDLMNGQTEGLGIGMGTFVTPRWSLEFEASRRRSIDSPLEVHTYPPPPGNLNGILETRTQEGHRMDSGTVLLAFHPSRRGRVQMAYAAGLTFVRLQSEFTSDDTIRQGGETLRSHGAVARTDFVLAPILQVEASVRLTRRVALVPYFRAAAFDLDRSYSGRGGAFVFRPGVALRINF
jgi:hypothetical protein